jgi:hypothetical protein
MANANGNYLCVVRIQVGSEAYRVPAYFKYNKNVCRDKGCVSINLGNGQVLYFSLQSDWDQTNEKVAQRYLVNFNRPNFEQCDKETRNGHCTKPNCNFKHAYPLKGAAAQKNLAAINLLAQPESDSIATEHVFVLDADKSFARDHYDRIVEIFSAYTESELTGWPVREKGTEQAFQQKGPKQITPRQFATTTPVNAWKQKPNVQAETAHEAPVTEPVAVVESIVKPLDSSLERDKDGLATMIVAPMKMVSEMVKKYIATFLRVYDLSAPGCKPAFEMFAPIKRTFGTVKAKVSDVEFTNADKKVLMRYLDNTRNCRADDECANKVLKCFIKWLDYITFLEGHVYDDLTRFRIDGTLEELQLAEESAIQTEEVISSSSSTKDQNEPDHGDGQDAASDHSA